MVKPLRRHAVRAVILTSSAELLLMRIQEPISRREVWFTPGGGMEMGESPEACLRRELREETGLLTPDIGPVIWTRRHRFEWNGKHIDQSETYHFVAADRFEPVMSDADGSESHQFRAFRWWTADDIETCSAIFAPRRLPGLLRALVDAGPPSVPLDAGI